MYMSGNYFFRCDTSYESKQSNKEFRRAWGTGDGRSVNIVEKSAISASWIEVFHLVGKLSLYENIITAKLETSSDERIRSQLSSQTSNADRSILHKTNANPVHLERNIFRLKLFPLFRFAKSCARGRLSGFNESVQYQISLGYIPRLLNRNARVHQMEFLLFLSVFVSQSSDYSFYMQNEDQRRNNESSALRCPRMRSTRVKYFASQRTKNKRFRARFFSFLSRHRGQFQKNVPFVSTFNYTLNSRFAIELSIRFFTL